MVVRYDGPDYSPEKTEVTLRPNLLYPSGRTIHATEFSEPVMSWQPAGNTGYTVNLTTDYSFNPPNSVYAETAATTNYNAGIYKRIGSSTGEKIGLQAAYSMAGVANARYQFFLKNVTTTQTLSAHVEYYKAGNKWRYYPSGGPWADLTGTDQTLYEQEGLFHRAKVIADFSTGNFVRLYSNEKTWDLSSISFGTPDGSTSRYLEVYVYVVTPSNNAGKVYIDNVTITEE